MSFTIVLIHPGGERKVVPVEHVANTYLAIRWGQSGIYDLNLAHNILTARSQKAQRKGKCLWKAEDIVAVRKMVSDYRKEKEGNPKEELLKAIERHEASMPQKLCVDPLNCKVQGYCASEVKDHE